MSTKYKGNLEKHLGGISIYKLLYRLGFVLYFSQIVWVGSRIPEAISLIPSLGVLSWILLVTDLINVCFGVSLCVYSFKWKFHMERSMLILVTLNMVVQLLSFFVISNFQAPLAQYLIGAGFIISFVCRYLVLVKCNQDLSRMKHYKNQVKE